MDDSLIWIRDAIEAVGEWMQKEYGYLDLNRSERLIDALSALPSAEPPYQYSEAYVTQLRVERDILQDMVNNMADRPAGTWVDAKIPIESGGAMPIQVCDLCNTFYPLAHTGGGYHFCPNCGARMEVQDG